MSSHRARTVFVLLGVGFSILAVWVGDYAICVSTGRACDIGADAGPRMVRMVLAALPFVLTGLFIGDSTSAAPSAALASRVAVAVVLVGATLTWGVSFYAAVTLAFGRTGGALFSGLLMFTAPVWLTAVGVTSFVITKRLAMRKPRIV